MLVILHSAIHGKQHGFKKQPQYYRIIAILVTIWLDLSLCSLLYILRCDDDEIILTTALLPRKFMKQCTPKLNNSIRKRITQSQLAKGRKTTTNLSNPYFILATFQTCFFSPFSSFRDANIKIKVLQ